MPPFKCPTPCHKFTIATESFRITTEGFHVGVGGGLALRGLRSNISRSTSVMVPEVSSLSLVRGGCSEEPFLDHAELGSGSRPALMTSLSIARPRSFAYQRRT
jgi:hypothetical protein